jgi:transformation/transcription domain-associated protein
MCTIAGALRESKADCEPILRLLMRDDIVAWYTSRSTAKNDLKTQELESQLSDRVMKNVVSIQNRFADCAPRRDGAPPSRTPVDKKVRELVGIATDPAKLCLMPTTFQAWL